jgi:hypothetical protein
MAETKRIRDYKHETALRNKRTKRLLVDVEIKKAERFLEALSAQDKTLASWLNNQIDKELNA